jgi:hypothetical protein
MVLANKKTPTERSFGAKNSRGGFAREVGVGRSGRVQFNDLRPNFLSVAMSTWEAGERE